ncbi:MAG: hypothetical protein ACLF0P_03280 [Thermoanaerobaculia bacterium]
MATFGQVPWKHIRKMLDECAPGWRYRDKTHKRWVYYGDYPIFRLPLGPHGKRQHHSIEVGHVKAMVRHLEIEECARRILKQLG